MSDDETVPGWLEPGQTFGPDGPHAYFHERLIFYLRDGDNYRPFNDLDISDEMIDFVAEWAEIDPDEALDLLAALFSVGIGTTPIPKGEAE